MSMPTSWTSGAAYGLVAKATLGPEEVIPMFLLVSFRDKTNTSVPVAYAANHSREVAGAGSLRDWHILAEFSEH
ncbi:uncharacterized protein FTJAE_1190 [Fusarium tjaetaba]|uniref:Uncharacterized protein n=1 Tax=Fusarium tjaetaba TaxID=1567544 RepID=A0A8H5SDR9_9HYPO|nr:uncharacterized protein FTJAE_1190 [Fusarium tjaetaba]KAF5648711.1 hypothetical protein FTJAE_1190 [Fusarium tjaetaba]